MLGYGKILPPPPQQQTTTTEATTAAAEATDPAQGCKKIQTARQATTAQVVSKNGG